MYDGRDALRILQTLALTAVAMFAFAANSLLCRLALGQGFIDPASFASIRLIAGATTLFLIVQLRLKQSKFDHADWLAALMLFAYVAFFSFAYLTLPAGTGALILFGAVQVTMFSVGLRAGEMFRPVAWFGFALAIVGLVFLVSPGVAAPPAFGAAMMTIAGVAWGVYSLRGRGVTDPLSATAGNFVRGAPFALVLSLLLASNAHADSAGIVLAVASGAITSGIGYVIWYAALSRLSAIQAATVQLSVPLIAAFGGVVLLSEVITPRLLGASAAILGGVALVLATRPRNERPR